MIEVVGFVAIGAGALLWVVSACLVVNAIRGLWFRVRVDDLPPLSDDWQPKE